MNTFSPGFHGRTHRFEGRLPPGQYPTEDFPVLSAGPTPRVSTDSWEFSITAEDGTAVRWTWEQMMALPQEEPTVDIHCVTRWSKFDTRWQGVPLDALLDAVETSGDFAMVESYGGYTTNLPLEDLQDGKAWLVHSFDGYPLSPEHGGPARLLVPHLYLWKSAKWVKGIRMMPQDDPGFWESAGYHNHGDPWREERGWTD
jgi:DMSO/TMAO reductase YedYZ molybdopterin-dependent catalytic subunit